MSPKTRVPPLSNASLKSVVNLLIHTLSDDEGINHSIVEKYLQDATYEILQDLLQRILNTKNLDAAIRFSCLQVVLREDVCRLDIGVFPHSYYEKILDIIATKGSGLVNLNLKGFWVKDQTEKLSELLRQMSNLKFLVIPHIADDLVLDALANCPKLSVLDISGECAFSKEGLERLKSDTLKVLDIGYYGKEELWQETDNSVEVMANILENLPNLTVLKTYSYAGKVLLKLYRRNRNFKTKLVYVHDTATNRDTFLAIVNTCPNLGTINFNEPEEGVVKSLFELNRLQSVKVSRGSNKEVVDFLKISGGKVESLNLNVMRDESLDLSSVCLLASDICSLDLFKTSLICLNPDNYFMCLHSLEVMYCDVSTSVLRYLLVNSPFLKNLVVGDVIHMTDGDIFRLCAECEFSCLEKLWFSSAKGLTTTSVELLMGHCPNLRILGEVTAWDISPGELDYLRAVIVSTNTNLILLPDRSYP